MNCFYKPAILIGLFHLSIQSMFGGLVSETPSMKDYQTGAEKLTVYTDVPGHGVSVINGYASRAKSDIYEIWVRSAATDNVWVRCFANMTYNRGKEMPRMAEYQTGTSSHGYQNFTAGWTHTYANIEMSDNSPVEVEIRKIGGTKLNGQVGIVKSAVHPAHKIIPGSKKDENGRVYFKIDKPCQIVIDINGQMDDHNAAYPSSTPGGRMPDGSPVHSLAFYANPVMAKPVASPTNTIVTVNPTESSPTVRLNAPDPASYDTLVFAPGVHVVGPNFKVHPGKNYYIPGDAIVYGNIGNPGVSSAGYRCSGDRINIFGYGTLCGIQVPRRGFIDNPEYPEWNAWDGEKGQNEGIEIQNAWDTKITGVSVVDPAGFNTRFDPQQGRTDDQCLVSWVKLHSWRVNGDGFGGYSAVEDSFIRACDDSTYVRSWRRRCTWWKDTNANIFRFINFKSGGVEDCDVIYARWRDPNGVGTVFEFANNDGTPPQVLELNLKMRNIRFHDKYPNPSRLINLALTESYTGLVFENISFYVPKNGKKSRLIGSEFAPWYERLVFKNITYKTSDQSQYDTGTLLTAANFNDYFETNEYVANVLFDHPRDLTINTIADPAEGAITKNPNPATHVETTTVTLTAVPNPNYVFSRWEGYGINASNATTNPLTIRVLDSGTVTARFSRSFNITERFTTPRIINWQCPQGVTSVTVETRGGGGAAGSVSAAGGTGQVRGGGGAGGSYARDVVAVAPGTTYKVKVGAGGVPVGVIPTTQSVDPVQTGGSSVFASFDDTTEYVKAVGGVGGNNFSRTSGTTTTSTAGGVGSSAGSIGEVIFAGGSGNAGSSTNQGGSGGAGAGSTVDGADGSGLTGGVGVYGGGSGGAGRGVLNPDVQPNGNITNPGNPPGGGGGGAAVNNGNSRFGGPGGRGEITLTYIEGLDHFEVTAPANVQAGAPFDVTITAKDASNTTVNGSLDSLSVTSPGDNLMEFDWNGDGIYGDNSGTLIDGVKIIKARSKRAQAVTLVAAVGSFTTSPACNVTIVPAAFAKLQVLVPGETSAPGTDTGKNGTPSLQGIGITFTINVNAVDEFWNIISTVTDTVQITSSDPAALLPANAALVGGTGTFTVTQNSAGSQSITATNLTTGSQSPGTSSSMTVQGFTWAGDGAANQWALNPALLNWTEPSGAPAAYTNGRLVNFNDTSTNQNVDIVGNLTPGSVTVDSSKNYMIGSTSGGSISGATGLTKTGSGTLMLSTANSYNGNTIVNAGSLRAGNNDAFGSSGTVTLGNTSATLELADGINISRNLTVSNTGDKKSLALRAGATSAIYSGTITNNETTVGNFEVSVGDLGSLNLSNSVGGNTLTKTGAGTLVLSGSTDNAGLLLDALEGEIQLGKDQVAGVRAVAGIRRIADGATVKLTGSGTDQILGGNGTNQGVNGLEVGGTLDLNGKSESISYLNGSGYSGGVVDGALYGFTGTNTLTVGESNVSTWFPGVIQNSSGTLNLVKVGSSMLTLIGPNTYSGTTSIQNGTLTVTFGDDRLPETTTVILGNGATSGMLRLGSSNTATDPKPGTASNQTITGLTTSGTGTSNAVIGGKSDTLSTLTLNNSTDFVFGGKLGGADATSNNLALTKTGVGTFTLTGVRTYTGPTNVQAGTLALVGGTHASPITVTAGGSLGFTLGSHATSTAAVDLTAGTVKITGTVDNVSSYKLMTAASFIGPFTLSPAIPNYELQLLGAGNTELWLVPFVTLTTNAVNGSVTPSPAGVSYNLGTEVTLTAVPDPGYRFNGWSGALTGSTNPAILVMDANKSVTATFIPAVTLTTGAVNGSITLGPAGGTYDIGTEVTVTAVANPGYQFAGWSGDLGGAANPASVVMDGNKSITAVFAALQITDFATVGSHDWVCPPGVTNVTVECWGGGGAAGSAKYLTSQSTANQVRGGGGAGGSFAKTVNLPVTPGTTYKVIVGVGGLPVSVYQSTYPTPAEAVQKGGESKFTDSSLATEYVKAIGGEGGQNANKYNGTATLILNGGVGSTADCIGEVVFAGGNGGTGTGSNEGGGGGGGAGSAANGGNGGSVTAGSGGASGGGIGGAGRGVVNPTAQPNGNITNPGTVPGGGGGGAAVSKGNERFGGPGGAGKVVLSYIEGLDHFGVAAGPSQTAGVPFDVTITALDTSNAKVDGIVTTVTLTSPGGSLLEFDWNGDGTYGDHSGALVNGTRTIRARNKKAETVTLIAAAHALTTPALPSVTTAPAAFAKLQILTPGETAAPGTASGKSGTPDVRTAGSAFNITVNAVDEFWNLVSSTDTVGITSSDPTATLPANAPLDGGTRTFAVTFGTAGGFTLTSSDITDGTKSAATSPALAVDGGSDPFTGWAGPGVTFDADTNKDGVASGLAWFLGAGSPDENSAARLPKVTRNGGAMVLEFDCLNAVDRGTAVFEVQYGQLDDWSETVIPGVAGTHTDGVVDFVITDPAPVGGLLRVVATIPASEATSGRVFGRIRGLK